MYTFSICTPVLSDGVTGAMIELLVLEFAYFGCFPLCKQLDKLMALPLAWDRKASKYKQRNYK